MKTKTMVKFYLVACVAIAVCLAIALPAFADTHTWTAGGAYWKTQSNWSPAYVPASGDYVYIENGGTAYLYNDSIARSCYILYLGTSGTGSLYLQYHATYAPSLTTAEIQLGTGTGNGGTISIESGGYLGSTGHVFVGKGTINQYGGTFAADGWFVLGNRSGQTATYNLSGGALGAAVLNLGDYGTGVVSQTGGSVSSTYLLLGTNGGDATYTIYGGSLGFNYAHNYPGTGRLRIDGGSVGVTPGGTMDVDELAIGYNSGRSGLFWLYSNVTMNVSSAVIGYNGSGMLGLNPVNTTNNVYGQMVLGYQAGSSGQVDMVSGTLNDNNLIVGNAGTGTFNQSGGTHNMTSDLIVGHGSGSTGNYNLSGGTLNGATEYVGNVGTGTFTQSGGTNNAATLVLGHTSTGVGTYNLNGGTLAVTNNITNTAGTSTFNINSTSYTFTKPSSMAFDYFNVGNTAAGSFTLASGKTLTVSGNEFVGRQAVGTFYQTGGTNTITGNYLEVGEYASSNGSLYSISGGTINSPGLYVGGLGPSTFTQSGTADVNITGATGINIRSGSTLNLQGGTLDAINEYLGDYGAGGTLTQTGGVNTVSNLYIGYASGAVGTYNLNGGTLNVNANIINNPGSGYLNINGGALTFNGTSLSLDNFTVGNTATGAFTLANNKTLSAPTQTIGTGTVAGTMTQQTGSSNTATTLTLGANGTYIVEGGTLTAGTLNGSNGTFKINGTSHTLNLPSALSFKTFEVGNTTGKTGAYTLGNGKTLTATNLNIGGAGTGTLTQQAGSAVTATNIGLGANGTIDISGGTLTAGTIAYGAGVPVLSVDGGTLKINTLLDGNGGTLTLAAGTLMGRGTLQDISFTVGDNVTHSPGASIWEQVLSGATETWASGGTLLEEVLDLGLAPGTGWDALSLTNGSILDFSATQADPFNITLRGLTSSDPDVEGGPFGWPATGFTLAIVQADVSSSILNFDPNKVVFGLQGPGFAGIDLSKLFLTLDNGGKTVNLNYDDNPAAIPEPSTIIISIIGLLPAAWKWAKKKITPCH